MRIVQITDLHLYSDPAGSDDVSHPIHAASLAGVLDHIQANVPDLDALVVSGDIAANTGKTTMDELAYSNLRRELEGRDGLLARTLLIPGNHDHRRLMLQTLPECCEADGADTAGEDPGLLFTRAVPSGDAEWRLVGLDSRAISGGGLDPQISPYQVERLRAELSDPAHVGKPTLVFMHHPPIPVGSYFDAPHTDLGAALADAIGGAGGRVRALFCGHVHWEEYRDFGGLPLYTTPSTSSQYTFSNTKARDDPDDPPTAMRTPHPPAYRVIEGGEGEGVATHVVWVPAAALTTAAHAAAL